MKKTDIKDLIREDLKEFEPYKAPPKPYKYKLDANESPYALPAHLKEKLVSYLNNEEDLNRYPDSDNTHLRNVIADFFQILPENVTCGVGSDQLIDIICKVFVGTGDIVLVPEPSFSMYDLTARLNKGKTVSIPLDDKFLPNEKRFVEAASEQSAKLIFLCTPNNPTGNSMRDEQIHYILQNVSCPVVVDEAYGEFAGATMLPYINEYPHMIILKTFSKIYGLAGIRVGYTMACEQMIEAIDIARPPYNLSTLSQLIAALALESADEFKIRRDTLVAERERVFRELLNIKHIKAYPSDANFIFLETDFPVSDALENKGVLIRKFSGSADGEKLRLSIATPEQNDEVLSLLNSICDDRADANSKINNI